MPDASVCAPPANVIAQAVFPFGALRHGGLAADMVPVIARRKSLGQRSTIPAAV